MSSARRAAERRPALVGSSAGEAGLRPARVLQTGLHPDRDDFASPEFKRLEGLTREGLARTNDDDVATLRDAGLHVVNLLTMPGDAPAAVVRRAIVQGRFDAILIGAGVRLVASNTSLFEALVNGFHAASPAARSVFNEAASPRPTTSPAGSKVSIPLVRRGAATLPVRDW